MNKNVAFVLSLTLFLLFSCTDSTHKNHLSTASSPYLRQHADNPVHWNEWGSEALAQAKKENKPLLISIGYASCHWCHVMEDESFMDASVAAIMNENFICIKVDREERPDIDQIYQDACQLINGSGGWPLNAFALPDGKPFYAGTYFSNKSWKSLLEKVSKAYQTQQKEMEEQAAALTKGISDLDAPFLVEQEKQAFSADDYRKLKQQLYSEVDFRFGGMKGAPKFPMPVIWEWLLQNNYLTGDKQALEAVSTTLTNMALGGIYDQVGGGFARYSTDSLWRVPHFEKMLYDNAQLISLYAHAYQVTQNPFFKKIVEETAAFVARELTSPEGGFYSSLNAVSDHEEGLFYAWSNTELQSVINPSDVALLSKYFNVSAEGNWKVDKNILFATMTPEAFAVKEKLSPERFDQQLIDAKKRLLEQRNKRVRPDTDSKILCGWNALMLTGYLDAYVAIGNADYLSRAIKCASFLENKLLDKQGHLFRNYEVDKPAVPGFLDDYALLSKACIRLYQVTFDKHWLDLARRLNDYALENFYDKTAGLFFYTPSNAQALAVRKMELSDAVIPSSNSIMCGVLHDLGVYFENADYSNKSADMLNKVMMSAKEKPQYYAQWCMNAGGPAFGAKEVAIVGADALTKNLDLQQHYLPNCLFMGSSREENLPLLEGKFSEGITFIYVCTNKTCQRPVDDAANALEQIR